MNLSVILPARNEEGLIGHALSEIESFLNKGWGRDYEILLVINGTSDRTDMIAGSLALKNPNIKLFHTRPGYGVALRKGLNEAKGKYIAVFNVDFYDLTLLDLAKIDLFGRDLIIGSKMTNWSDDRRPAMRRVVSFLFNLYLRLIYGFAGSDTHGIKIMRSGVVKRVLPKCKTSSGIFDTEFVLRTQKEGFAIVDFPVRVEEKRSSRFQKRLFQTPKDLIILAKAMCS